MSIPLPKKRVLVGVSLVVVSLVVIAVVLAVCLTREKKQSYPTRTRPDWGTATAAYQIEGAWNESGRAPSIWDTFAHTAGKTDEGATGDVASNSYHLYKTDFDHLEQLGARYYRFSVAWPRIVPGGVAGSPINAAAIKHYNDVIDELLRRGVVPVLTLFHWDLPQVLQDKYDGWLGRQVATDFAYYAEACFAAFGDRVKHWATLNEPWTFIMLGYNWGGHAPGIKGGDKSAYTAAHNALLAHAAAVQVFRAKYVPTQGGRISIALNCDWAEPLDPKSSADMEAATLRTEFYLGWFADPVIFGDYPQAMRDRLGARLPSFTAAEKALLKGSIDYFQLNHYTSMYVTSPDTQWSFWKETRQRKGRDIGPRGESDWLYAVPWGFGKLLQWVHERYNKPEIWVTESGASEPGEGALVVGDRKGPIPDPFRLAYYKGYVAAMEEAIDKHGVDVRVYFAWSLIDNFEWADGYTCRFGIVAVDFQTQRRVAKQSAIWLRDHFQDLRRRNLTHPVPALPAPSS